MKTSEHIKAVGLENDRDAHNDLVIRHTVTGMYIRGYAGDNLSYFVYDYGHTVSRETFGSDEEYAQAVLSYFEDLINELDNQGINTDYKAAMEIH